MVQEITESRVTVFWGSATAPRFWFKAFDFLHPVLYMFLHDLTSFSVLFREIFLGLLVSYCNFLK